MTKWQWNTSVSSVLWSAPESITTQTSVIQRTDSGAHYWSQSHATKKQQNKKKDQEMWGEIEGK
jgi:hypothetical protein